MISDIKIIYKDRHEIRHIQSDIQLQKLCDELSGYICSSYLYPTAYNIIKSNFFYLSKKEQQVILNDVIKSFDLYIPKEYVSHKLITWFRENQSLNIDGFVSFRINRYYEYVNMLIEEAVDKFIVNMERTEIINYFKHLLNSQAPFLETVHVYSKNGSYSIMNSSKQNIVTVNNCDELFLNIMLTIAPTNIYFYGTCVNANFFDTLSLVFENRLKLVN